MNVLQLVDLAEMFEALADEEHDLWAEHEYRFAAKLLRKTIDTADELSVVQLTQRSVGPLHLLDFQDAESGDVQWTCSCGKIGFAGELEIHVNDALEGYDL